LRGFFDLSGKLRNFREFKKGGASIVVVIFIAVSWGAWVLRVIGVVPDFSVPFERGQGWANGATNSSPVKHPVDGAVPHDRTQHAAHMRDDLPSGTYVIRISPQVRAAGRV
jgi:hypothetical protein